MKTIAESALAGLVTALFSYWLLITPAILAAVEIRRKYPEAWFSGLIVWYASFAVIGTSLILAAVAFRKVYQYLAGGPTSTQNGNG